MNRLIDTLRHEQCSCVIATAAGDTVICRERGVKDLLHLLKNDPDALHGAMIADKVVGKGAAALMALGGVSRVHAEVISTPARTMLLAAGIATTCGAEVPAIINRSGTGICPIEALTAECATPSSCLPLIETFINHASNSEPQRADV